MEKTKICKYCRKEIDAKAKVCPNCHRSLSMSVAAIIVTLFIAFIVYAYVIYPLLTS